MASPGDQRPAIWLPVREQLAYSRIVQHETNAPGRRLLDIWARPEDLGPNAEKLLTETFRLMWRTPPDRMEH
jgi:hypothetical protein